MVEQLITKEKKKTKRQLEDTSKKEKSVHEN